MNLLVTGAWQQAPEYIPIVEKWHEIRFLQYENDNLPCNPGWVEGIIGNGIFLNHPIESFTQLKYIQLTSAGFDRVPMDYVKAKGIRINNARGVYSIPMAEYTISGVLAIYKKMPSFWKNQRKSIWSKERNIQELYGKVVCIIGCGSVGSECAKRFEVMGCKVVGIDPIVKERPYFAIIHNTLEIKAVLSKSDIVIITLPLTHQTRHIFDKEKLSAMKDNAVLVNIARGALIETDSLITELKSGRISAVLDVFEEEPLLEESELWTFDNVIITPHNSFVGEGNGERLSELIIKNLEECGL